MAVVIDLLFGEKLLLLGMGQEQEGLKELPYEQGDQGHVSPFSIK